MQVRHRGLLYQEPLRTTTGEAGDLRRLDRSRSSEKAGLRITTRVCTRRTAFLRQLVIDLATTKAPLALRMITMAIDDIGKTTVQNIINQKLIANKVGGLILLR